MSSHVLHLFRDCGRAAYKAFNKAAGFIDDRIPDYVPRDRTTKALLSTGALAYIADIWDPFPIGETIAATCGLAATARGAYIKRGELSSLFREKAESALLGLGKPFVLPDQNGLSHGTIFLSRKGSVPFKARLTETGLRCLEIPFEKRTEDYDPYPLFTGGVHRWNATAFFINAAGPRKPLALPTNQVFSRVLIPK